MKDGYEKILDLGKVGITIANHDNGMWDKDHVYERMTLVMHPNGNTYVSKKTTVGVDPAEDVDKDKTCEYWFKMTEHGHNVYEMLVAAGKYTGTEAEWIADAVVTSESAVEAQRKVTQVANDVAELKTAIKALPDGQAVTATVAEHTTQIADLGAKVNIINAVDFDEDIPKVFAYQGFIGNDGSITYIKDAPYLITEKLSANLLKKYSITMYNIYSGGMRPFALYDSNDSPVYVATAGNNQVVTFDFTQLLEQYNADYVRICVHIDRFSSVKFNNIESKNLTQAVGILQKLPVYTYIEKNDLSNVFHTQGYIDASGNVLPNSTAPYHVSDYLLLDYMADYKLHIQNKAGSARLYSLFDDSYNHVGTSEGGNNAYVELSFTEIAVKYPTAKYIVICMHNESASKFYKVETDVRSSVVGYRELGLVKTIKPIFDYNIVLNYGQSLSIGWSRLKNAIQGTRNTLMLGNETRTCFANTNPYSTDYETAFANATLKQINIGANAMTYVASSAIVANCLAARHYKEYGEDKKFISIALGEGAKNISQLMDTTRYADTTTAGIHFEGIQGAGWYRHIALALNRIKAIADSEGKTCGVVAVCWINGEQDNSAQNTPLMYSCMGDRSLYVQRFTALYNDLNNDIRAITGQSYVPSWFIGMLGGKFMEDIGFGINQAQYDICEREGIYALPPVYAVSNSSDGHPTGNGFIWAGEQYGRSVWDVLYKNLNVQRCRVKDYTVHGDKIKISFYIPNPPLQFDVNTLAPMDDKGFVVEYSGSKVGITGLSIVNDTIEISLAKNVADDGKLKIYYATSKSKSSTNSIASGEGNLRDSSVSYTYYKYQEDMPRTQEGNVVEWQAKTQSGGNIVGNNYPMYFFCESFVIGK